MSLTPEEEEEWDDLKNDVEAKDEAYDEAAAANGDLDEVAADLDAAQAALQEFEADHGLTS